MVSPASSSKKILLEFESDIGITFRKPEYLQQALTHKSFSHEKDSGGLPNNERMEFLGDSILGLIVGEYLFKKYPLLPEGALAKIKSLVVSKFILNRKARDINLGQFLLLSKSEKNTGGRNRSSILANAFEALICAIYLDQGVTATRHFILKHLKDDIDLAARGEHEKDYKSLLQELAQREFNVIPRYSVVQEMGPDHDKTFITRVSIKRKYYAMGIGRTKKEAEQKAACNLFIEIEKIKAKK